jgi:hypothetical protein
MNNKPVAIEKWVKLAVVVFVILVGQSISDLAAKFITLQN